MPQVHLEAKDESEALTCFLLLWLTLKALLSLLSAVTPQLPHTQALFVSHSTHFHAVLHTLLYTHPIQHILLGKPSGVAGHNRHNWKLPPTPPTVCQAHRH